MASAPRGAMLCLVYQIYDRAFMDFDFGLALSQSVIMMIILVVLAVFQFRWLGGGVEY
jgi:ABC-type sugar transport system permease subunit